MPFTKGHKINVGRIMPLEERLKHRMIGKNNPAFGKPSWNKNKKCPQIQNENNGCWKGESASYTAKHIWMVVHFGKANKCENKNCKKLSKKYHWANLSGKYKRNRNDWKMLCVSCHSLFDKGKICLT